MHLHKPSATTMLSLTISKPFRWFSAKNHLKLDLSRSINSKSMSQSEKKIKRDELRQVFQHFDVDQDGKLSSEELRAFFASAGVDTEARRAGGSHEYADDDQMLSFDDFMAFMETEEGDEDLKKAFEVFEAEKGSGRITPRGLQRVLSRLGDDRSVGECEAMIRAYDLNGDGELDFQEFHHMMS